MCKHQQDFQYRQTLASLRNDFPAWLHSLFTGGQCKGSPAELAGWLLHNAPYPEGGAGSLGSLGAFQDKCRASNSGEMCAAVMTAL